MSEAREALERRVPLDGAPVSEVDRLHGSQRDESGGRRASLDRAVIDASTRAVVVTDESGRVVLWNLAVERLYGWAEHEVLGRSVLDVLAPAEDMAANRERLAYVTAGNVASGDRTVIRRDGRPVRVATFTRPMFDDAGRLVGIVGTSHDIAGIRHAEQAARDLTEHFRLALEAGGLGTWRWDITTGVTTWDQRLEALFGLGPGEFDATFETYVSLLHPDDRDDVLEHVQQAVATASSYSRGASRGVAGRVDPLARRRGRCDLGRARHRDRHGGLCRWM